MIERRQFKIALGALGIGALLYGLYRAYRTFYCSRAKPPKHDLETLPETNDLGSSQEEHDLRHPYSQLIEDPFPEELPPGKLVYLEHLRDIRYHVIMCLSKGNSYQGIVNLSFHLGSLQPNAPFWLNFQGAGIKYLRINNKTLEPREVKFQRHLIEIPRQLLREHSKNAVEVIFENGYSFMGNGLSSYFQVDGNNKYSLRQQLIYSQPGWNQVANILPCLNCLNQCTVELEAIHPESFEAYGNSVKQLRRNCSIQNYTNYPFLFDFLPSSLARTLHHSHSQGSFLEVSKISDSLSNYTTASAYHGRKRANSHFQSARLPSIHGLFIFCSNLEELLPSFAGSQLEDRLILRYFCKESESHHFYATITHLHHYILDIYHCLNEFSASQKVPKIQIFILNDREADGAFFPGALLLSQQSVKEIATDFRCFYLIARGICGLLQMAEGQNVVSLDSILQLNSFVFQNFEELRDYMHLQNISLKAVGQLLRDRSLQKFMRANEAHFLQYYSSELKYLLKEKTGSKISFQINNITSLLESTQRQQFWESIVTSYNFLSVLLIDSLVELGIKEVGIPARPSLLDQLKICLDSSRHVLSFYSDREISDNLSRFIECRTEGLEYRLPRVKVLAKYKNILTDKHINFLAGKSNVIEAEDFYNQFKKFNERKNFHHLRTLGEEVRRVLCFGDKFIRPTRVGLNCSWPCWRLLRKLKIYPQDRERFRFMSVVDDIQQC